MATYRISTDSSSDLTKEELLKYDIDLISLYVSFDGENYYKDAVELSPKEFYQQMNPDIFPKTSLPNIQDFLDVFKKTLEQGLDIIHFSITTKFSGSYQAAINAKNILEEEYPDRIIEIIDSKLITLSLALLVIESTRMRDANFDLNKNIEISKKLLEKNNTFVTVDSLKHLQKGGRIGKAQAFAGGLLNIKPVILLDEGELIPVSKVRGRKKALSEIVDLAHEKMGGKTDIYNVSFTHSDSEEDCNYTKNLMIERYNYNVNPEIRFLGPIVGTHLGVTGVALSFCPVYESELN